MAQLSSSALNPSISGRSDAMSSSAPNAPAEQKGFAEMMAGAIQNQRAPRKESGQDSGNDSGNDPGNEFGKDSGKPSANALGASSRAQAGAAAVGEPSQPQSAGQTSAQKMALALNKQINVVQEKIQALTQQNPPLSDKAQTLLNTLTKQLSELKQQLEKAGGSAMLDGHSLAEWLAKIDELKNILQQGDVDTSRWTGQLQAMVQQLSFNNEAVKLPEERLGQNLTSTQPKHAVVVGNAPQTTGDGQGVKEDSAVLTPQAAGTTKTDNVKTETVANNNNSLQNNSINSGERSASVIVPGQIQRLSGAIGSALSVQAANSGSTVTSLAKGIPTSDLVLQLADPAGNKAPNSTPNDPTNNALGVFNLSASGFGAAANTPPLVVLPGTLALNQPRMTADLGQNIQFMMGKAISRATLEVNPAHLGPMKILIDQKNNQTTIQIMASHHLAKDMLDQNMPRLREWLQDAGLGNAQVTVTSGGQEGSSNQAMNQGGSQGFGASAGGQGEANAGSAVHSVQAVAAGQVAAENKIQNVSARLRLDTFA